MLNTKLIYLYSNKSTLVNHFVISFIIFPAILPAKPSIISLTLVIFMLFIPTTFNKYKNLVLEILDLKISSHIINKECLDYLNL